MRPFSRGVVAVMAPVMIAASGGVAVAEPNIVDPIPQEKHAGAGWDLKLSLENINIESVPNMAAAGFVREGYVTATAQLTVDGSGDMGAQTILRVFTQVGCQADLENGAQVGLQPQVFASLPGLTTGDLIPGNTDIGFNPTIQFNPSVQFRVRPGHINSWQVGELAYPPDTEIVLKKIKDTRDFIEATKMDFKAPDGIAAALAAQLNELAALNVKNGLSVSVQNMHLVVDGATDGACVGPVAVRLYADATMSTARSSDSLTIYSDIVPL